MSGFTKVKKDFEFNGVKFYDYIKQLDYNLQTEEERIALVQSLLYTEDGELNKYLLRALTGGSNNKQFVEVCLNKSDSLSEDVTIFKMIENMANYIINSPTADRLIYKQQYNFYRDSRKFKEATQREHLNKVLLGEETNNLDENQIIDFLLNKNTNFKKSTDTFVSGRDKKEIKEIAELETAKESLINKREVLKSQVLLLKVSPTEEDLKLVSEKNKTIIRINNVLGGMRDDQRCIKEELTRPIRFKEPIRDGNNQTDWEQFDFFNEIHVEALLHSNRNMVYDDHRQDLIDMITKYIKAARFNNTDTEILDGLHIGGTLISIANKIGQSRQSIFKRISYIVQEIMRQHELFYSDWYYTYIVKGKYDTCLICGKNTLLHRLSDDICHSCKIIKKKMCSSCNDIKILDDFGLKKSNMDGHKSLCKVCEKDKRELDKQQKEQERQKKLDDMINIMYISG